MAKNTEYEFEETMVTLTDEDGIDKDFWMKSMRWTVNSMPL